MPCETQRTDSLSQADREEELIWKIGCREKKLLQKNLIGREDSVSRKMLNLIVSTENLVEDKDAGLDWYMNKSFRSRTVKVLNSVHGGCCKLRFMDELLGGHEMPNRAQPIQPKHGISTCQGIYTVLNAAKPECDAGADDNHLVKMMTLAEDDEDDDIGKMTLKEMRRFLRKSAQKSSKEQIFSQESGLNPRNRALVMDTKATLDSSVRLGGLELHLDSSTSNSAESGDDLSPRGVATSSHKPIDDVVQECEAVAGKIDCPGLGFKKRKSTINPVVCKSEISIEDDDCTLEMWQAYKRQASCGKRSRRCAVEQVHEMGKQTSFGSSLTPSDTLGLCSMNLAPDIDEYLLTSTTCPPDVALSLLDNKESGSPAVSCSFDPSEEMRQNDNLKPNRDLITTSDATEGGGSNSDKLLSEVISYECAENSREDVKSDEGKQKHSASMCESFIVCSLVDAIEGDGSNIEKLHSEVLNNENTKTSREDMESDEGKQKHSSLTCESSTVGLMVDPPVEDGSERTLLSTRALSWGLRPSSSTDVSSSLQSKLEGNCMVEQQTVISCEVSHGCDHVRRLAAVVKSGQSPMVEEPCSIDSCISKPSVVADSAAAVLEPFARSSETLRKTPKVCELANKEVADLSEKTNINELSIIDNSEDSPAMSAVLKTGFSTAEQSISNVNMVCQLVNEEETFGSPVSLFSTERLDAEEEQESEQLKPSKIPCKRKAISPLSRERLLQASKFGDRERVFHDLDKRGLKKLPRAFKGFIGRDSFNQDRVDVYARAKHTVMLESSPPEKPHEKEEVLPGSPCHNREKFLTSKSFLPKVSSISSSSYGDSIATETIPPNMLPHAQRLSLVLNSSPSPPSQQQSLQLINGKSPVNSSPSIPAKGILRSSSPTCQGACKCEECVSLRSRAERAAEFSQRQMHDIEGLAVKLLKELNTMRRVVEESLIQRNASRADSPRSALSLEKVKKAASNALETEKMAKSWLVRMARDCNRYCKIMRMQERKLTFADESGGQLCHVKLFHSQPQAQPNPDAVTEKPSLEKENASLSEEPAASF